MPECWQPNEQAPSTKVPCCTAPHIAWLSLGGVAGMVDLAGKVHELSVEVVHVDPVSLAKTTLHSLHVDMGMSWEEVNAMRLRNAARHTLRAGDLVKAMSPADVVTLCCTVLAVEVFTAVRRQSATAFKRRAR